MPSRSETIEKHIKRAWIAATVSGSITLLVVICTLAGAEIFPGFNAWNLIDIGILFGFAFGVAKRSRICAVLLVIYWIFNEGMLIVSDQKPSPLGLIFIYFFIRGAIATFRYNAARKATIVPVTAKGRESVSGQTTNEGLNAPKAPPYRVARGGVEIGQFEASDFFDAIHSGVVRLDDFVWMVGLANWIPVSDLLSASQAKEPQIVPSVNSIASVSPPKTPSKEKFASIAKGIGGLLFSILAILVIGLILIGGAKLAASVQPWAEGLAGLTLGIVIPVCLLLLIFRKTRRYGGIGIYFASYAIGLALWISCFLYSVAVSLFWTIIGILMAGLGIVPVAAIMTLIHRDWSNCGSILGAVVVVFVLRGFGAWIVEKSEQWNAEAKLSEQQFEEHAAKKGNYFARHWRGQLSLGVSYWVSSLVSGLLVALVAGTVKPIQEALSLRLSCGLSMFLFALAIASTVWWLIGVWRSASGHVSRGGRRFWAGVAEAMVVLGFLNISALTYKAYIPQSIDMLSIIVGDVGLPPYQIRVLPGETDIEFRGGIRAGSARKLERILAAVPQAKVLHIESPGGRIEEAKRMMKLVRERGLTTYTSEECESAATLVLVSGKQRVIGANAKVGFHAGTVPGITLEQQRGADDDMRSIMQSAGVSEAFIERTLATPSDQMWFPSFDEMLRNGVATASYDAGFTTSIAPSESVFLTERVGVTTHSGVTGLPLGTALHVVSETGDTSQVTNGTLTFDVPKTKLTTDANLAARLAQDDYAAQQAAAQLSAQQMEAYRQAQAAKRAEEDVGYFVPKGGGPVIPATPENLSRFGPPVYATRANAARVVQAQAARQQQAELQRAQAAKRIAANNGQNIDQTAAQQQALQPRYQEEQDQRQWRRLQQDSERSRLAGERDWQQMMQRQREGMQQFRVDSARKQVESDRMFGTGGVTKSPSDREVYQRERQQLKNIQEDGRRQRQQQQPFGQSSSFSW